MSTMICVQCQLFMKIKKNGVTLEQSMPSPFSETGWAPYKLWEGDLYKCQQCGFEIISGLGRTPIAEHFLPNYDQLRLMYPPMVVVNDCPGAYRNE